jgi:hypothetical protein
LQPSEQDSEIVRYLVTEGQRVQVGRATVFFPPDIYTPARMRAIAASYDSAIIAIETLIGAPRPWQRYSKARVTYYLAPGRFVSHERGEQQVFIPVVLQRRGNAPVIHETAHAVLTPTLAWVRHLNAAGRARMRREAPTWLHEGLATYISARLSTDTLPDSGPSDNPRLAQLDTLCVVRAATPMGPLVMPYVGAPGYPPSLSVDRNRSAPAFYACSASYVKFLVDRYGVDGVAALVDQRDVPSALAKLTGKSAVEVREEWFRNLPAVETR